jgi:hypothetical protein
VWDINDTRYVDNTPTVALTGDTVEVRLLSSDNDYSCITSVDLDNQGLIGEMPDVSKFTEDLTTLKVGRNPITGSIQGKIEHLVGLDKLYLNQTDLNGDLPPVLTLFPNLKELSLGESNFNASSLPDISGKTQLEKVWVNHCDYLGKALPDFTGMANLITFHGGHAKFISYSGGAGDLVSCQTLIITNCNLDASSLQTLVNDLWSIRTTLGGNGTTIRLQSNTDPMPADAIAKIEGTGSYAGDGLVTYGCTVEY